MILSEKITYLRKKSGWSQEELAEKLNISRQSVSKWESGTSIPDIDKIIAMSGFFGVSTDYLLKDEIEKEQPSETDDVYEETATRSVSLDEANGFMNLTGKVAGWIAAAVSLFILCPVPLILLAGLQEYGKLSMAENAAGGIGVAVLLVMVAVGVAIVILNGMQLQKYEYIEKESISLQYGVQGIVAKKKEEFEGTFRACLVIGITICILSVVPMMLVLAIWGENELALIYSVAILLAMVAAGVFLIVWSGEIHGSFQKLLQEGEYTPDEKALEKKTSFFSGIYWCLTVAIFLAISFHFDSWKTSWIIWPVAALLFVVINGIIKAVVKARAEKQER